MQNKACKSVFETDNISSAIFTLAMPTIVSQLITTIYNLADTFWVGKLNDPYQLAALTVVFPTQLIMTAFGNLFGIGAGTCISNCLGAKKYKKAGQASSFAVWWGCLTAIIFSLITLFFRSPMLSLLGSTESLNVYSNTYLDWVIVVGALPSIFNMIVANMIRGEGASLQSAVGLSMGGILNIILDPFFVLPAFLGLEIKGAAIATLLSNFATTVYFIILLIVRKKTSVISLVPAMFSSAKSVGRDVIFTGVPSALQTLFSAVSNQVLNSLMIGYGEFAEAAVGVTKKIDAIPFGILTGLSQGASPLLAYNYGAKRDKKLKKTFKLSLTYCIITAVTVLIIVELFAPSLISFFVKDQTTMDYGTSFLRLHCISIPFMSATLMFLSFFQAVGAKIRAFVLSIIRKGIVDIPMMFLMNMLIPMYGIIACQPITDIISAVCGVILFVFWNNKFHKISKNQN